MQAHTGIESPVTSTHWEGYICFIICSQLMVWTRCVLFQNLWLAAGREPTPVPLTDALEERGDGSS